MQRVTDRGVLIIGGPTASGKTSFAIELAERYDAEIVGADSRQIYRDMPIGTAAPTTSERERVRHHLIAFVDPYERYSAARFVEDAAAAIGSIHARGKRAIVVGGTGFYLRALCGEVRLGAQPDPLIRARVLQEERMHPIDVLHAWLTARDPRRAAHIAPRDRYRIIRALEIALAPAGATTEANAPRALPTLPSAGIAFAKVAVRADAATLAPCIAERTAAMIENGLLAEAERIGIAAVAADAVGYREALAFRKGELTFDELRETLARATRQYAKRQLTWFRAEPNLTWIDAGDVRAADAVVAQLGWKPRTDRRREADHRA